MFKEFIDHQMEINCSGSDKCESEMHARLMTAA
jgi:hypothetical protein